MIPLRLKVKVLSAFIGLENNPPISNYEQGKVHKGADFIKRVIGLPGDRIEYIKDRLTV
jgi:signal peptidase I